MTGPGEQIQRGAEAPEMGSEEAVEQGCTCSMEHVHAQMISPPEYKRDRYCPVHSGYDPDAERDRRIDREDERTWEDEQ